MTGNREISSLAPSSITKDCTFGDEGSYSFSSSASGRAPRTVSFALLVVRVLAGEGGVFARDQRAGCVAAFAGHHLRARTVCGKSATYGSARGAEQSVSLPRRYKTPCAARRGLEAFQAR